MHKGFWANLPRPIIGLAPMDGVTDAPLRYMIAKYAKPDIMMTEFTTVEGLSRGALRPLTAFLYDDIERPIAAQIFGSDPEAFYKATFVVAEMGFDGVDINMGCPAKNVAGKGAGAGLIQEPQLAKQIIRSVKQAARDYAEGKTIEEAGLPDDIIAWVKNFNATRAQQKVSSQEKSPPQKERQLLPVSVKTRIGYSQNTAEEWVKHLLEEQPVNITIHGRTLKQMYTGRADWDAIASATKIIRQTQTTVMGNGDIQSVEDGLEKARQYGVDGFMIGRATFGKPTIFGDRFSGRNFSARTKQSEVRLSPDPKKISPQQSTPVQAVPAPLELAVEHARLYEQLISRDHFTPMRKHLAWYCKGFPGASEIRQQLMRASSADDVEKILQS